MKTLLTGKAAPKGWPYFTVHAITHDPETASGYKGKVAADMIGAKTTDDSKWGSPSAGPHRRHDGRARVLRHRADLRRL